MARLIVGFNDLATVNPELAKQVSPNSKIKATEVMGGSHKKLLWMCSKGHEWEATAYNRSKGKMCPYCSNQKILTGFNDLATTNPQLAKEVSPNSKIKATEVAAGSDKKLLWRCSKGHEWEAKVNNRSNGVGCPYCSNRKVLVGFNDLATINTNLAKEVSSNSEIKATEIAAFSNRKTLWRCNKGHEWEATVASRSNGVGCPYCSNRKVLVGFNDLATINTNLAKEVSPNSGIKATEITVFSNNKLLWRCSKGHEWEAIVSRRSNGVGCPYCSNKKVLKGFNDLATTNPKLSKEVSPNSKIKATEVTVSSNKKFLWRCDNDHEWKATVNKRYTKGHGCPYCSNHRILIGFNDLSTVNPELTKEVSPNSKIKATEVFIFSNKKLLWRCNKGHEWEATANSRSNGRGCPYCSNNKVLKGFNDLATTNPKLSKEVSPNSKIKATEVTAGSEKKLLWRCSKGHEWDSTVANRSNGCGCPRCSGSKMERDFAQLVETLLPENTLIVRNDRQLIKPYELDILIPSSNLAFEFNGDYWHSNEMIRKRHPQFDSSKQFDDFKKQECKKQGVKLFFVKEKQWVNNYDKTVNMIKKIVAKNLSL